jgi:hypothetical protein
MTLSLDNTKTHPFEQYIEPDVLSYLQRQQDLFEQCRSQLLETHADQFVWFENGVILDADVDQGELFDRAMDQDPERTVFIAQVLESEPKRMVRSPRLLISPA